MLLYIGAFQFVPMIAVMALVLLSSIAVAIVGAVLGRSFDPARSAGAAPALFAIALAVVVEIGLRLRDRMRRPGVLHDLRTVGRSPRITADSVGGKAFEQARLVARLGLDVPEGCVLTREACAAEAIDDAILVAVGRRLGSHAARVVVRSSFVGEDGVRTHAGIFASVRDVDARDTDALRRSIDLVRASGRSERARAYDDADEALVPRAAVLVQRQVDGRRAVANSRAFDGRADVVVVEIEGRDEAVVLDLLALDASAPDDASSAVPDRAALLRLVLRIEAALGGPVQVELVHDGERWWVVQARRLPLVVERRTYLAEGPVALDPEPRSALVWALRGGTEGVARGLAASLAAAGRSAAATRCTASSFVLARGLVFADAELLRHVVVDEPTWRDAFVQLRFLFAVTPRGPSAAERVPTSLAELRALADELADAHAAQAKAVLRLGLLGSLVATLEASVNTPTSLPALLRRRIERERRARDHLRSRMQRIETDVDSLERLAPELARAFVAERSSAEAPTTQDRDPGSAAPGIRWHVPPLDAPAPATDGRCTPIVDVPFEGRIRVLTRESVLPDEARDGAADASAGTVYVIPDGGPSFYPWLKHAAAVILLRGGVLSHLATLALEARVPAVLWLEAPTDALRDGVEVRYRDGRISLASEPPCSG